MASSLVDAKKKLRKKMSQWPAEMIQFIRCSIRMDRTERSNFSFWKMLTFYRKQKETKRNGNIHKEQRKLTRSFPITTATTQIPVLRSSRTINKFISCKCDE